MWKRPPGGGAACWLLPWTGSSDKVKLRRVMAHKVKHITENEAHKSRRGFKILCSSPVWPPESDISSVILTVHYDCEQAVEQRLEALVSAGDDFVENLNTKK